MKSEAFKEGASYKLHVHQYGDLFDRCMNTGEPYNPMNAEYADGNSGGFIGNLGEFTANGSKSFELDFENLPFCGEYSVLARSLVILDEQNNPLGCGIIGLVEGEPPLGDGSSGNTGESNADRLESIDQVAN